MSYTTRHMQHIIPEEFHINRSHAKYLEFPHREETGSPDPLMLLANCVKYYTGAVNRRFLHQVAHILASCPIM